MVWRSCAQAAEDSPCLEDPSLDSGLLVGPSFGAEVVSPPELWSDCSWAGSYISSSKTSPIKCYSRISEACTDMQLPCGLLLGLKSLGCNDAATPKSTKDGKALRPGSIETVCSLRGHSETRNIDQYYSGPTRIKVICDEWDQEFGIFTAEAWETYLQNPHVMLVHTGARTHVETCHGCMSVPATRHGAKGRACLSPSPWLQLCSCHAVNSNLQRCSTCKAWLVAMLLNGTNLIFRCMARCRSTPRSFNVLKVLRQGAGVTYKGLPPPSAEEL